MLDPQLSCRDDPKLGIFRHQRARRRLVVTDGPAFGITDGAAASLARTEAPFILFRDVDNELADLLGYHCPRLA